MTTDQPLVSIGVPVYNDAPWLRNALDHLLNQDYNNLEIILADDCSSDGSREICREYANRDARIRLFENKHNLGAYGNHKLVFDVSTGDYFAWGSGHDYFEPSFISRTLEILESNPSVLMCCGRAVTEDATGKILSIPPSGLDTRGLPPVERFRHLLYHQRAGITMNIFYGLYRAKQLAEVKSFMVDTAGNDALQLGEQSLTGDLMQIDEILFHRVEAWVRPSGMDVRQEWLKRINLGQGIDKKLTPRLNMIYEYLRMVYNSGVSIDEREALCEDVNKIAQGLASTIQKEIKQFIDYSKEEMLAVESQPILRRYRASQVLTTLEHALLLGFDCESLHEVRATCLMAIGLETEAKVAAWEEAKASWAKRTQKILKTYPQKMGGGLHKLVGDKVWERLRKISSNR